MATSRRLPAFRQIRTAQDMLSALHYLDPTAEPLVFDFESDTAYGTLSPSIRESL